MHDLRNKMQLSYNFTLEEMINSNTASRLKIDNTPTLSIINTLKATCLKLENVRNVLNYKPIIVNSGFRSLELNRLVGGVASSQHTVGEAVDFICPSFGTPFECCQEILKYRDLIKYDQLIYEYTWVHISFTNTPRGQEFTKNAKDYVLGIKEINNV